MLDLHCHILPQLDDGANSLEEALAMARFFVKDGTTHVVATPHCHRFIHLLRADVLPRVAQFNRELRTAGIPLTILPGSEIQVVDAREYRREFEERVFCHLGDGRAFTLLEFNWARNQVPPDAADLVAWIVLQGMTPIIAHPERHAYFSDEPELLRSLVAAGAWLQITVDSLTGYHGPAPKVAAAAHLREYPLAVLSTDAHTLGRCSGLSPGYAWVREHLGERREHDLRDRSHGVLTRLLGDVGPSTALPAAAVVGSMP